jgi:hypothetical protein
MVLELTIETRLGKGRKGRSFHGVVLAYATASGLWGGAAGDCIRPVCLSVAASDDEARSLLENLRAGERARMKGEHLGTSGSSLELVRSANYAFAPQRTPEGTIVTAYLPDLFDFHPGLLDPEMVRFVLLPARHDFEAIPVSPEELTSVWRHLSTLGDPAERAVSRDLCAMAVMWAGYLDQRCELPIPPEIEFRVQLLVAALREGLASRRLPLKDGTERAPDQHPALGFRLYVADCFPLVSGIACRATHEELCGFLADQIQRYERTRPKAARRRHLTAAQRKQEAA